MAASAEVLQIYPAAPAAAAAVAPSIPPPPAGFSYYEDLDSASDRDADDDDDDAVNIRVSYVQHAEVVAKLRTNNDQQQQQQQHQQRHHQLQQQLFRLPNRMAAALARISANLNCYQPRPVATSHNSRGTQTTHSKHSAAWCCSNCKQQQILDNPSASCAELEIVKQIKKGKYANQKSWDKS